MTKINCELRKLLTTIVHKNQLCMNVLFLANANNKKTCRGLVQD